MATERWQIDAAHSGIHFSVRHMLVARVRGQFTRWSGSIVAEDGDFARASIEAIIDAGSIETGVADRDAHLRSKDFLDVATYPEITFKSVRIEREDPERLRVAGDLTICGVTREVVLHATYAGKATDPWGHERAGFAARTSIDRRDFGVTWNEVLDAGGALVGDRVEVEIEIEAVDQTSARAA
jgi:polyisoprenoid-binding protein YceI